MSVLYTYPNAVGTGIIISSDTETYRPVVDREVCRLITDFELNFSRFRSDSTINCLSHYTSCPQLQWFDAYARANFPHYAQELFQLYDVMYEVTHGHFNPAVAEDLIRLGYGHDFSSHSMTGISSDHSPYRVTEKRSHDFIANRAQWGVNVWIDSDKPSALCFSQYVHLDFSAAAKGYLVDLIAQILHNYHQHFTIDAGGDLYTTQAINVALENPWNDTQAVGVTHIHKASLCASAPSRRHWTNMHTMQEVHHIVDGITGENPRSVEATWVSISDTSTAYPTAWCDALATALFVAEPLQLLDPRIPSWQYARVNYDKSAEQSQNWQGRFFIK